MGQYFWETNKMVNKTAGKEIWMEETEKGNIKKKYNHANR